jgi:hypothetical protein
MVPHSLGSTPAGLTRGDERVAKASRNRAAAARARLAEQRAQEARRKRRRNWIVGISAVVVVTIAAVGITLAATSGGTSPARTPGGSPRLSLAPLGTLGKVQAAPAPGRTGPENVPIPAGPALASTSNAATGRPVDGIRCQTSEQLLFHIHAHLTVFVNGSPRRVPAGIGIPGAQAQDSPSGTFINGGTCLYWLHTHAADGIIHVESPVRRTFTLGQVFHEWGQPLGTSQVGPATGQVTALYNGKVYRGNPRNIPLNAHAQIQLEIGKPLIAPESITFPNGL